MDMQKQLLIKAVVEQMLEDIDNEDFDALEELLGSVNEDVMIGYIDEDTADAIYPE